MMTAATLFAPRPRAGPSEGTTVLRAQIELSVCDQPGAGTSDPVSARLRGGAGDGDVTWLDRAGPNFERAGRYRYDLILEHLRTLADVSQLVIDKPGDDDLCLRELTLIINGRPIFARDFSGGRWLRAGSMAGSTLRTTAAELRANATWQHYAWSLPEWVATTGAAISRDEVADRLTSGVASAMHGLGFRWAALPAGAMIIRRKDDGTLHASTGLTRPATFLVSTPVALDFDLRVCAAGRAEPRIVNVAVSAERRWYAVAYSRDRQASDERMLNLLAARLENSRPLMLPGELCPRIDARGNIGY